MIIFFRTRPIHVPRIPFTAERRNGVNAPVDEDSELCVSVPARNFVGLQRLPIRAKWSLLDGCIDPLEHCVALGIVLATCLSPDLIDAFRILRLGRRVLTGSFELT